jgi:two-component system NtrC family sensor kinase
MPHKKKLKSEKSTKTGQHRKTHRPNTDLNLGPLAKSLFDLLPVGIVTFDRDLKITDANPLAETLIRPDEQIDKSLASGTDKELGRNWTQQFNSVIAKAKIRRFDTISYTTKGQTKLLRIVCMPLRKNRAARPLGAALIIEDITEKTNADKRLANTERLAAVGKLATKVAHELNNPMDGILRYINLAIRIIEQENLDKPRQYLTHCRHGIIRMVQIVSELLQFARGTYPSFEELKIDQIIEDAVNTMAADAQSLRVRIFTNYDPRLPKVRSGNLFQVFCNLVKNALDAMPEGGELNISAQLLAQNIVIKFQDTGEGFVPENAELIFEPFFTTKEKNKGTGLGLAISKDIVAGYNGRITAENAPAGGSIFTVYLPVTGENP